MTHFSKAIDEIRADESRQLKRDGYEPVLKHSRWCLLKRPANLTRKQTVKLAELVKYNLRSVRAYRQGQRISFPESEVWDWTIIHPDGREEGNYVGKFIDMYKPR